MEKLNYSGREAGAKTFWVIEFLSRDSNYFSSKKLPNIHFIPTAAENYDYSPYQQKLGVCVEELEGDEQSEEIEELCDTMEGTCEKSVAINRELKDHSKMMNEQIENLGKIVENFHDILREFKNKEEGKE